MVYFISDFLLSESDVKDVVFIGKAVFEVEAGFCGGGGMMSHRFYTHESSFF